jgi:hypothetical protein
MGGLANIIADSSYNGPNVGYSLPVSRGARTVLFPRVDGPTSIANKVDVLAGGVGNATVVGTPGYGAGYAKLTASSNYLNTGSVDVATTTIMAVVRTDKAMTNGTLTPAIGGNFTLSVSGIVLGFDDNGGAKTILARRVTLVGGSPSNSGVLRTQYGAAFTASISGSVMTVTGTPVGNITVGATVYGAGVAAGTTIAALGNGAGGAGTYFLSNSMMTVASEPMAAIGTWAFVTGVFENNVGMTLYNKTLGISNFLGVTTPHIPGAGAIKAGSVFGTTYSADADFAFWAEHNVALTATEIEEIYQAIKGKLAAYASPIII